MPLANNELLLLNNIISGGISRGTHRPDYCLTYSIKNSFEQNPSNNMK